MAPGHVDDTAASDVDSTDGHEDSKFRFLVRSSPSGNHVVTTVVDTTHSDANHPHDSNFIISSSGQSVSGQPTPTASGESDPSKPGYRWV